MKKRLPLVLLLVIFLLAPSFSIPVQAQAAWLAGWDYRRSHVILGTAVGAQSDYQVKVQVYYADYDFDLINEIGGYEGTNPVIPVGAVAAWDEHIREIGNTLYEPTDTGREYKIWFSAYSGVYGVGTLPAIGYAYSSDGITWTKVQCVGVFPGGFGAEDPYVIKVGNTYYMYFELRDGTAVHTIARAHSTDCVNWIYEQIVLSKQGVGWESGDVASSINWIEGATWYMVYEGRQGGGLDPATIGMADSADGLTWVNRAQILGLGPAGKFDDGQIVPHDLVKIGLTYYLSYNGHDGALWRSGMQKTDDFAVWTRLNTGNPISEVAGGKQFCYDTEYIFYYWDDVSGEGIYRGYPNKREAVLLAGECKTDFGDIRFMQGAIELDYWLQEKVDSEYAIFWVKIPTIPASPDSTTIYIYYGNEIVATTSDGDDTFPLLFDHFDNGDYTDNWAITSSTVGDSFVEAGTVLRITSDFNDGGHWSVLEWKDGPLALGSIAIRTKHKRVSHEALKCWELALGASDAWADNGVHSRNGGAVPQRELPEFNNVPALVDTVIDDYQIDDTDYHVSELKYIHDDKAEIQDNYGVTLTNNFAAGRSNIPKIFIGQSMFALAVADTVSDWDWIFVRKYVDPEPIHGAWGAARGFAGVIDYGISNMEGCGNWVFAGDTYYEFFANVTSAFGGENVSVGVGFFVAGNWFSIFYNSTTGGTNLTAPGSAISGSTYSVVENGNNVYIVWLISFHSNIIDDSDIDLYIRVIETGGVDSGWFSTKLAYFNIYNVGGYATYDIVGTAGRRATGFPFEIWADGAGSSIRANLTYRNLQHIHFLVSIEQPDVCHGGAAVGTWDDRTWLAEYGLDFCYNDVWYEGLTVRFELLEGHPTPWDVAPAVAAWVDTKLNVTWFYAGDKIKSDQIYAYWDGYKSDEDWTRVWVDLWFSNFNGSTTIAGRTSSYNFGMRKKGFLWWTSWDPHGANYTQSSALVNLAAGPSIISCKEIELIVAWANVTKADLGEGVCAHKIQLRDYDFFSTEFAEEGYMQGIDTPSYMDTTECSAPQAGSVAALVAAIIAGVTVPIVRAITETLSSGLRMTAGFLNMLFAYFGIELFVDTMTTAVITWGAFFIESVINVTLLIVQIFTIVRALAGFIITWFTRFVAFFFHPTTGLFAVVSSILQGTNTVLGVMTNVWDLFEIGTWIDAIPVFATVAWFDSLDKRARRMGGGWLSICIGDLQTMSWVVSWLMDMMFRVINFCMDIIMRLVNTVRP